MDNPLPGINRRILLKAAAISATMICLPAWARSLPIPRFPTRTMENSAPDFDPARGILRTSEGEIPYVLKVDGLVEAPQNLTYADLRDLPQHRQVSDFHCVEGWSVHSVPWGGVLFDEIVRLARPKPEAKFVTFHSIGETRYAPKGQEHYIENLPLEQLLDKAGDYLLALDLGDDPLPADRGAPMRLVCPYDLAYKSIKFIERIEFVEEMELGWWTLANAIYPWDAPVPESRLRKK